jgi:hypothetical protein
VTTMNEGNQLPVYFGQVEKDLDGRLWAAVYRDDPATSGSLVRMEQVASTKRGKQRVVEMVMKQRDLEMDKNGRLPRVRCPP